MVASRYEFYVYDKNNTMYNVTHSFTALTPEILGTFISRSEDKGTMSTSFPF